MKISILRLFGKIWTNIYKNKSTYLAVATVLQLTLLAGVWLISNIFRLALNFAGDVSISATALEDSDIFIYLVGENK